MGSVRGLFFQMDLKLRFVEADVCDVIKVSEMRSVESIQSPEPDAWTLNMEKVFR